ncbi:MAG: 5-formyltetrahydrofolate cyclo-ligase [Planctomycetaceae bacterium]|jgi:5-formyltetrahydrofolate cyclo-ligase|nr:5-formyltetrahydrofolate cyclo-ligase [Planctomycetaceae bacterium]
MTIEKKTNTEKPENAEILLHDCEQSKRLLRRMIRAKLHAHSSENAISSSIICTYLSGLEVFQVARKRGRLMIYLSFGDEVRTTTFLGEDFGDLGDSVVVPYCEGDAIIPIRIYSREELELGRFGILEPKRSIRNDAGRFVGLEQLDVIIVPGLAFDEFGNRLGRGKGYYDRFLSRFPLDVISIGLAFEHQIVSQVPVNHWDCPVSMVITEKRCLPFDFLSQTKFFV